VFLKECCWTILGYGFCFFKLSCLWYVGIVISEPLSKSIPCVKFCSLFYRLFHMRSFTWRQNVAFHEMRRKYEHICWCFQIQTFHYFLSKRRLNFTSSYHHLPVSEFSLLFQVFLFENCIITFKIWFLLLRSVIGLLFCDIYNS
jgi:hypothetical protein